MRQLALRAAVNRHWREKRQCLSPAFFFILEKAVKSIGNAVIPMFPMHRSYGFQHLRHKRPRLLSPVKVGNTTRLSEKNRTQRLARAFPPSATARSCAASEIATERTAEGSGCTPMACVRFLRRRGPVGLRDLFRFCRNCGLYALRSGPFRVCEARGGITTLSALYVLLKRRTAACQNGSFAVF